MANDICSVSGCDKEARVDGKCMAHYMRLWRRGVHSKKGSIKQATESFIHKTVSDYFLGILDKYTCKIWPYGTNDKCYGRVNGISITGHTYIAKMTLCKPENKHMIAHRTCGVKRCVNPHHMEWRRFQNRQRLTKELKHRIKLEQGTLVEVADKYGLHYGTVSKIRNDKY